MPSVESVILLVASVIRWDTHSAGGTEQVSTKHFLLN